MSVKKYLFINKHDRAAIITLLLFCVLVIFVYSVHGVYKQRMTVSDSKEENKQLLLAHTDSINRIKYNIDSPVKLKEGQIININKADTTDLKKLPGIGSSYAKRILAYRIEKGRFDSINELQEIKGIKGKTLLKIIPYISLESEE